MHDDDTSPREEQALQAQLAASATPYLLRTAPGGDQVELYFAGPFDGRETLWDARIVSLYRCPHPSPGALLRRFIEIAPARTRLRQITIALDVTRIDEPTVRKTVTMIRNYKRLRVGRIEWGPPVADATP